MTVAISSECVLLPSGATAATVVVGEDGHVESIEPGISRGSTFVDGTLSPGFIDLQVNGKKDVDVWNALATRDVRALSRLDGHVLDEGVTTWLPTLVTNRVERYPAALEFLSAGLDRLETSVPGAHLEGPLLGTRSGAHRGELIVTPPSSWWDEVVPHTRLVTLGAEHPDASEVTHRLVRDGVVVSIGHSAPTRSQFEAVVTAGASMVTHLFNAMSGVHHRDDSLALWALNDPRVTCGLIVDGIHVDAGAVDLAFRSSRGGIALVTDAVAHLQGSAGPVTLMVVDGAPRLSDGTLAGSCLTMNGALDNARVMTGLDVLSLVRSATEIPARVLGLSDRGRIEIGRRADLVALGESFEVHAVWLLGRRVR